MNTNAKGARLERRTRKILEERGYKVTRAGGSFGVWDLVAIGQFNVVLIQVKANRWPIRAELRIMEAFPAPALVSKEIWRWDDRVRQPRMRYLAMECWLDVKPGWIKKRFES